MAKRKSTNSVKQSAVPAKRKASATKTNSKSATKETKVAAATTQPAITSAEIGRVAGDVWGVLHRNDGLTLAAIKKSVNAPADVVVAAIGWLAREDKLEFSASGRAMKVSLR